jgi:predicted dienelactone hydrolase
MARFGMTRIGAPPRVALILALILLLVVPLSDLLVGLSPTAADAADPYPVKSLPMTFVDRSRPTSPNNAFPGAPDRTLSTLIMYPERGARDAHRYPLVVFAHGFGGSGPAYEFLYRSWAAAGYIVAAPTFPSTSMGAPGGLRLVDFVNQPADVSFVIGRMIALNDDRRSPLHRNIDTRRIGVAGHSLGAVTTLGLAGNSCCRDPRIDAVVAISGVQLPFPNGTFVPEPAVPLLLIHGTADPVAPYAGSANAYIASAPPKYFVTLADAGHGPRFGPAYDSVVQRSVLAFFDAHLLHRSPHRIEAAADVPGVASLQTVGCRGLPASVCPR